MTSRTHNLSHLKVNEIMVSPHNVKSCDLIFMCLFRKLNRPLDFVLPVCFILNHAKYLRRIKWEFVNMFLFQGRGVGRGVAFLVCSWDTLFYDILSATWLLPDSETGKRIKKTTATSSLLWKVTAEVGGMELLSLDNKTTNSGINDYRRTVQAVLTIPCLSA